MEEREHPRVMPDLEVFDADGQKAGTVGHVYELQPGAAESAAVIATAAAIPAVVGTGSAGLSGDGAFELKTGLFGLGKHYYIPFSAVKDVTGGGVFLNTTKADFDAKGWHTKPDYVEHPEQMQQAVSSVRPSDVAQPEGAPGTEPANWDSVRSHYRTRWTEHYGTMGAQWETYEPRYRFAWDIWRRPEYQGRSWISAQPDLRNQWEALHPDLEWETISDSIRDAWEHPPATTATPATPATTATTGSPGGSNAGASAAGTGANSSSNR